MTEEERKEKFFINLLQNYFNKEIPCYDGYDFNAFIKKIKSNKDFRGEFDKEIMFLGTFDKDCITSEPEIFDFPNKNKRIYFKYINFFHYYYACLRLKNDFFQELDEFFKKKNLSVYHDIVDFSENFIYEPLDNFLYGNKNIKSLFNKKYQDIDMEIVAEYDYILENDIANYFPSIYTHLFPRILNDDYSTGKTKDGKNYKCFKDIDTIGQFIDYFIRYNQNKETIGIPIGSMLYAMFAEIISIDIDNKFMAFLETEKIDFKGSRIVDDRTIGFRSIGDAEKALKKLREILHNSKLNINIDKTRIIPSYEYYKEVWINDINSFCYQYETKNEKDKIIQTFNNTIFYWFNIIKANKEKQSMIKYSIKTLCSTIKKYKIISKSHIVLLIRLIKAYTPAIQFLLPIVEIIKKDKKSFDILKQVVLILEKSKLGESGEVLWCLMYIKKLKNDKLEDFFKDKIKNNVMNTKNSFCFQLWNDICAHYKKLNMLINNDFCEYCIFHVESKTQIQKNIEELLKRDLFWFRTFNYKAKCNKCNSSISEYRKKINNLTNFFISSKQSPQ